MLEEDFTSEPNMTSPDPVYMELVDFLAAGSTPREVAGFRPSAAAQARVSELLEREKDAQLSPEETSELEHFLELEHILRMAKARARLLLADRA